MRVMVDHHSRTLWKVLYLSVSFDPVGTAVRIQETYLRKGAKRSAGCASLSAAILVVQLIVHKPRSNALSR